MSLLGHIGSTQVKPFKLRRWVAAPGPSQHTCRLKPSNTGEDEAPAPMTVEHTNYPKNSLTAPATMMFFWFFSGTWPSQVRCKYSRRSRRSGLCGGLGPVSWCIEGGGVLAPEMVCRDWLGWIFPRLMCHERKRDHGIWDGLLTTIVKEKPFQSSWFSHIDTACWTVVFPTFKSSQISSLKTANRRHTVSPQAAERFLPLHYPLGALRWTFGSRLG